MNVAKLARVAPSVRIPGGDLTVRQSWTVVLSASAAFPSPFTFNASTLQCQPAAPATLQLGFRYSSTPPLLLKSDVGPDRPIRLWTKFIALCDMCGLVRVQWSR